MRRRQEWPHDALQGVQSAQVRSDIELEENDDQATEASKSGSLVLETPDQFGDLETPGFQWTLKRLLVCDACVTLFLYLCVTGPHIASHIQQSPWRAFPSDHNFHFFTEFGFQPDGISVKHAREQTLLLKTASAGDRVIDIGTARHLVHSTRRTSAAVLAMQRIFIFFSAASDVSCRHLWTVFNYAAKLLAARALYSLAKTFQAQVGQRLDEDQRYLFNEVKLQEAAKVADLQRAYEAEEIFDEEFRMKKGEIETRDLEYLKKGNQCWSPLIPTGIFLLHPFSIYSCTVSPSIAYLSLWALLKAYGLFFSKKSYSAALVASGLFGLYAFINTSFLFPTCLPPLVALWLRDSAAANQVSAYGAKLQWYSLCRYFIFTAMCLLTSISAYIALAYISYCGARIGPILDFNMFWTDAGAFLERKWFFVSPNPNTGSFWYIMIVMFAQAKPVFAAFIQTHLIVHSFPLTLRCRTREELTSVVLVTLLVMFESEPSAVVWPLVMAFLFFAPGLLVQMRIAVLAMIVMQSSWALQTYVFELWLTWDIANATVAFNTVIVPFIILVVLAMSVLLTDYQFSKVINLTLKTS